MADPTHPLDDPSAPLDVEVHTFEKKLLSSSMLFHSKDDFRWHLDKIYDHLVYQLTGYLTARELKNQKIEIPNSLLDHFLHVVYTRYPLLKRLFGNRFQVTWRNIMPTVIQAIDVPIISGHRTQLYVMESFKF